MKQPSKMPVKKTIQPSNQSDRPDVSQGKKYMPGSHQVRSGTGRFGHKVGVVAVEGNSSGAGSNGSVKQPGDLPRTGSSPINRMFAAHTKACNDAMKLVTEKISTLKKQKTVPTYELRRLTLLLKTLRELMSMGLPIGSVCPRCNSAKLSESVGAAMKEILETLQQDRLASKGIFAKRDPRGEPDEPAEPERPDFLAK